MPSAHSAPAYADRSSGFQSAVAFNYAGLEFDFEGPRELLGCMLRLGETFPAADAAALSSQRATPKLETESLRQDRAAAVVHCRLNAKERPAAKPLPAEARGWLRWHWEGGEARVMTREAEARVHRRGLEYAVDAWLPPDFRVAQTLVAALGSAILHGLGGVLLHASSALTDSGVVAFIGPSGAGKSTACRHLLLDEGQLFSVDRLALAWLPPASATDPTRRSGGWYAYPLPGGTALPSDPPRAAAHWAPLRGIFRIHQAAHGAWLEECSTIRSTTALRESAFHASPQAAEELELLARLEQLSKRVPVARLHFSLGTSLAALLCR